MNILTIPFRNVCRKPSKTLLLLLVFALGVTSIVALYQVSRVVGESLEKKLTAFGANIVIAPAAETLDLSYGGFHMGEMLVDVRSLQEKEAVEAIHSIPLSVRISAVAPKFVTREKINGSATAVVGVRWEEERKIKSYWAVTGEFPRQPDQVLLGSKAAATLALGVGDQAMLFDSLFTVSGVLYETGGDDDNVILAELETLQNLTGRQGMATFIEVAALCSGCPIEDIVAQLQAALPGADVTALQSVVNQRMASVQFVQKLALTISLVILVTAAFMVSLSMLSAVNERKKDIGILRSMGYGKLDIFLVFSIEAGIIGLLAGSLGYLAGHGASFKVLEMLALADGALPVFSGLHLLAAGGMFGVITILSALYPAWKGARIEPSEALLSF